MTVDEAKEDVDLGMGAFPVNSVPATVLFDFGASHSFVTKQFARKSLLKPVPLKNRMLVQTAAMARISHMHMHPRICLQRAASSPCTSYQKIKTCGVNYTSYSRSNSVLH
jgi:hypothetical protein